MASILESSRVLLLKEVEVFAYGWREFRLHQNEMEEGN